MSRTHRSTSSEVFDTEPWQFIVLRSQNISLLRPEKSWRPIVTLEVDGHCIHEVVLGSDGQNPNQRDPVLLRAAHHGTEIKVGVWHKATSKSKNKKKRQLVASTSLPLGEAFKRQGKDRHLEIRLSGITAARRKSIAQKQQTCASLLVRLRAPQTATLVDDAHDWDADDRASVTSSVDKPPTDALLTPPLTSESDDRPPWAVEETESSTLLGDPEPDGPESGPLRRRRKRIKGYCLDSADEQVSISGSEDEGDWSAAEDTKVEVERFDDPYHHDTTTVHIHAHTHGHGHPRAPSTIAIVLPSLLPIAYVSDTMSIASASSVSLATSVFDMFTHYRELREAQLDSDFERILARLTHEWYYVGASLLSVAALDTTVFGFNPDTIFGVDGFAKRVLTVSAICAALGLALDAWFLLLYGGADVRKFQTAAVDLYSSFFFFSLSSRLPLLALFASVVCLMIFLVNIAFAAWPVAVLVLCLATGTLVSLQFIIFGFHRLFMGIAWVVRGCWRGMRRVVHAGRGAPTVTAVTMDVASVAAQSPVIMARQIAACPS